MWSFSLVWNRFTVRLQIQHTALLYLALQICNLSRSQWSEIHLSRRRAEAAVTSCSSPRVKRREALCRDPTTDTRNEPLQWTNTQHSWSRHKIWSNLSLTPLMKTPQRLWSCVLTVRRLFAQAKLQVRL